MVVVARYCARRLKFPAKQKSTRLLDAPFPELINGIKFAAIRNYGRANIGN